MKSLNTLGKRVYLVGIKGAGMAGLAQILQGLGYRVEGSDIADSFFTDDILKREGIPFHEGFDAKRVAKDIDWAVSSSAYLGEGLNSEVDEIKKRGVPIVSYPEALAYFFNQACGIAVTGTHGKSTTAAMVAYILEQAGKDPFALIGGELLNWHSNARVPKRTTHYSLPTTHYFVIEADEYREQFLHYKPAVIAITNIDYDHSDYFPTPQSYQKAFEKLKKQLKYNGFIIQNSKLKTPAFAKASAGRKNLKLSIIGEHNQQNAALAYEVCKKLGVEDKTIREALKTFKGLRRRLEKIGEYKGALIIDDYAHHPVEITASLEALRESFKNKKIIVLFHPHTYSRTKTFLKEFAKALTLADEIYLLDVYGSAREKGGAVGSDSIVEEIENLGKGAVNLHTIKNAIQYFQSHLAKGDVLVTMGAGDVFRVALHLAMQKQP